MKAFQQVSISAGLKNRIQIGQVSSIRSVPDYIRRPPYVGAIVQPEFDGDAPVEIKSAKQIEGMRKAGNLAAKILKFAGSLVKVL
jgi:hypothetical protein